MSKEEFVLTKPLRHIAFIMDGNGRWAKARGLPRTLGHKKACEMLRGIFDACYEQHIYAMSFFAFSTENWNRPEDEITHLMDYLEEFFKKNMDYLLSKGARVIVSGDLSRLRPSTRETCLSAIEESKGNDTCVLNVCLNYGGRDDIVHACRKIAEDVRSGKLKEEDIDERLFASYLYTAGLPDVDLLVRTSGEQRISNYMLYQIAYAELVFTPVKWPDFDKAALIDCLKEYCGRNRRFGGLKNE